MRLTDQWLELEASLPAGWGELHLGLGLDRASEASEVSALLAPLQPLATDPQSISLSIRRDGNGPGPLALRSGLERLDARRLHGTLSLVGCEADPSRPAPSAPETLGAAWTAALASVPEDWSDLLGEIELDSSDYLDRAAVNLAPINPRRSGEMTALRFRSARRFGYGAAPGVVRACLERCDRDGIRGRVQLLRVLCDSKPVGTQGPVWQIDGEMV